MSTPTTETGLVRNVLAILFLAILVVSTYYILAPFLAAVIWAVTIATATWSRLLWLQGKFGGRRGPAAAVFTLLLLTIVVVPLVLAVVLIVSRSDDLVSSIANLRLPPAPGWVEGIPMVGGRVAAQWNALASAGTVGLAAQIAPHLRDISQWFLSRIGGIGATVIQLLLTVAITAILYVHGEEFSRAVRRFALRIGGAAGEQAVDLAGAAIRGVALGVVVTAVVQSGLSGLGLMIASVPFAPILTAIMLILCIAQVGPMLVLIPVVIWGFSQLPIGWAIFLLVWTLFAGTLDNWLRPILIRRGVDLPLLLIFAGVIGGLMAFGLIGIFVGPVALAITYTLLRAWVDGTPQETGAAAGS